METCILVTNRILSYEVLRSNNLRVLVCMDKAASAFTGRPCAIQDEEYVLQYPSKPNLQLCNSFDVDLPIDCNDEYWAPADPGQAFKQPLGKPSCVAFFISLIELNRVLALAMRTVVSSANILEL